MKLLDHSQQIAHSLGPIRGEAYTNSLEAFHFNYAAGFRAFEIDIVRLGDGAFVAAHPGLEERYGCAEFGHISADQFPKSYLGLKTLTWADVLALKGEYDDVSFIIDIKSGRDDFYRLCASNSKDIIPQLYTREDLSNYHRDFPQFILALWGYNGTESDLESDIGNRNIKWVSLRKGLIGSSIHNLLVKLQCNIIWHDEIYADEASKLLNQGDSVMMDCHYLRTPEQWNYDSEVLAAERIVSKSYMLYLGRQPDTAGLNHYKAMLVRGQADAAELSYILMNSSEGVAFSSASGEATNLPTSSAISMRQIATSFYEVFYGRTLDNGAVGLIENLVQTSNQPIRDFFNICASSQEFRTKDYYIPISGQYNSEGDFCWFNDSATIVLKSHPVYITIPSDFPFIQSIQIQASSSIHEITLRPGEAYKLRNTSAHLAQVISLQASAVYCPLFDGINDGRALSFQVTKGNRDQIVIRHDRSINRRLPLVAVSGSPKEARVLRIVISALAEQGMECLFFDEHDGEFKKYVKTYPKSTFFIASADTFFLCERLTDEATYIYIEHGIAPFKGYTYARHYKNYDHILLPSQLWKDRIEKLHGKLDSVDVVGYPVLAGVQISHPEIDLLVAPTWTRTAEHMIQVASIVESALSSGLKVAFAGHPDSIASIPSDLAEKLVPVQDVYVALGKSKAVLTDFSSIGIEAAVLDIPVMLMQVRALDDFDSRFLKDDRLYVPYGDDLMWNIGPVITENSLLHAYQSLMSSEKPYSEERRRWAQLCHVKDVLQTSRAAAESIMKYFAQGASVV